MRGIIKKTVWAIVIGFGVLVVVNQSIPLILGKGNCPTPLKLSVSTQVKEVPADFFEKQVTKAVEEWENKTGFDLFEIVQVEGLKRNEKISTITAVYKDNNRVDIKNQAGWTDVKTMGTRVKHFNTEIYNYDSRIIYGVILHELGHGRGLEGHSPDPKDIMFEQADYAVQNLSNNDIQSMIMFCKSGLGIKQ